MGKSTNGSLFQERYKELLMKKRVIVTGANGQVATEYQLSSVSDTSDFLFLERKELNIASSKEIKKVFKEIQPEVVINLAAYTNVEKAEKEETSLAFEANATGPKNLAVECNKMNIPLVHLSTDYVFDGSSISPYTETSLENPLNQYGRTKFLGEKWIQETHDWYYIIRTSWVYSNHSKNFFTTMLNLAQERHELSVVEDQFGSPTSAKEICRALDKVLENLQQEKSGVYHFSGLGRTSWKDFATEIFNQTRVAIKVNGVPSSSWKSKVERPVNSYMSSEKFANTFGYFPAHWKNALREVIAERKIVPIKVGDTVMMDNQLHLIVSTDWLKRVARLALPNDVEKSIEVPFELLTL
jgi:dTDP-4-dehydrorhamnose reductase